MPEISKKSQNEKNRRSRWICALRPLTLSYSVEYPLLYNGVNDYRTDKQAERKSSFAIDLVS